MHGEHRREELLNLLKQSEKEISGTNLAKLLNVSRQVIVQDIALLRASNRNILSTTKGYLLYEENVEKVKRVFAVCHNNEQIMDELNTFVDNGGKVLNVIVDHEIYGSISVDLIIRNRRDVIDFVETVQKQETVPLMGLTRGMHYHTIEAESEEVLDFIQAEINRKGYLVSP